MVLVMAIIHGDILIMDMDTTHTMIIILIMAITADTAMDIMAVEAAVSIAITMQVLPTEDHITPGVFLTDQVQQALEL